MVRASSLQETGSSREAFLTLQKIIFSNLFKSSFKRLRPPARCNLKWRRIARNVQTMRYRCVTTAGLFVYSINEESKNMLYMLSVDKRRPRNNFCPRSRLIMRKVCDTARAVIASVRILQEKRALFFTRLCSFSLV